MRRLALVAAFIASPALAQAPAGDTVSVPMTAQERGAILSMCPAAVWAQRQQFEGLCDYFKSKFEAAEKAAAAEKAKPEKKD